MFTESQNLVVPKGRVLIDLFDADGNPQGMRYLGKSSGFELGVESENLEYIDAEAGLNEKFEDRTIQVTRTFTVTVNNINPLNEALFLVADVSKSSTTADSVTAEAHTVKQGLYYQLGQDTDNPSGVRAIESVVVNDVGEATPPTYIDGTDYEIDLALGLLYIIPGGGIADDTPLEIDYDTTAVEWDHLATSEAASKNAALRFVADNPVGDNQDVFAPRVAVRPTGTRSYKAQEADWVAMQIEVEVLKPTSGASLYTDGRAVSTA